MLKLFSAMKTVESSADFADCISAGIFSDASWFQVIQN
jgi:hypothetical protein